MKIEINIRKNYVYFLVILLSFSLVVGSAWNNFPSHDELWVKEIFAKDQREVSIKDNLKFDSGKDLKIKDLQGNEKSVINEIVEGNGIKITKTGISRTISLIGGSLNGYEFKTNSCSRNGDIYCSVGCSSGKKVLSGGCSYTQTSGNPAFLNFTGPSLDNKKWECSYVDVSNYYRTATASVICINY